MKIVGRDKLTAFCLCHPDGRKQIACWLAEAGKVAWKTPQDIKDRYASVSFLSQNRVIFNVKGNDYRLETTIAYKTGVVIVDWIGTHADYDARNQRR
ncbi:MAG: type II toxin-antitoxin system HigB family toxin [Betaproteobacteria bacterium]|nr:type II toxin-antitoxin system HigB family toxin [Betaproteobacteria bacterium]MBK7334284.1 type II toxin-antitoxin system HigB family toxin [Betaproteobacteria bacterium]